MSADPTAAQAITNILRLIESGDVTGVAIVALHPNGESLHLGGEIRVADVNFGLDLIKRDLMAASSEMLITG